MIYLDAWKPPESTRPSYSRRLPANKMKLAAHRVTGFGTRTQTIHMGSFFAISSKFSRRRYGRVYFCKTPSSRAVKHYHQIPDRRTMHIYGASDYALTDGGGDFTVHVVVGLTPENDLYLLDMWRRQADSATSVDAFLDLVRAWRPLGWSWESGQIRAALGPYIKLRQRQRNTYVATETFPTKGDKAIRAQSIRG